MGKIIDITGQKFGRWTIIKRGCIKNRNTYWICKCKCGILKEVNSELLRNNKSRSCGCLSLELVKTRFITHGFILNNKKDRFYKIWEGLKQRCLNKKNPRYKNYGGRRITVCNRWLKFENFRDDMYESYLEHCKEFGEKDTQIDRKNNNGNYLKENCRWATIKQQSRNKTSNKIITFNGETKCLVEWAEILNIKYSCLANRLCRGWNIRKTLTTPIKN